MTPPPNYAFPVDGWAEVKGDHVYIYTTDAGTDPVVLSRDDIISFRDWLGWASAHLFVYREKK